jgi:hypothetical protein
MRDSAQSRGFVRAASLRVLSGFAWPCDPGATLSTSAAVDLEREHAGALQRTLPPGESSTTEAQISLPVRFCRRSAVPIVVFERATQS